ncbi:probable cardiolipin synthase (CMP-forming) [Parasteatoda tepidariorum]|uniref:probable cardiolipin synthase (CMP-forming) n=1 Tax=Parasteatoda tepidariorum TaxID=114398 RepID=UPI001C7296F2|nr:probable cardiolipin synthase (CMP-forming) [Parasteatoda tepidariorum]
MFTYGLKMCISPQFLINFKNVIKLKQSTRLICNQVNFSNSHSRCIYRLQKSIPYTNYYMTEIDSNNFGRHMSKWIKSSSNGIPALKNSKKRRNRSTVFAERVTLKLQHARRETKRKVQNKIGEIKENILTVPNGLCVLRIISTPLLGYLVISEYYTTSLGIFMFAGFTDLIDGYIARNFPNQQTMIGSFLDPAADKLLISTLFVTLTINGLIPVPLTSLIIIRDAVLFGAGFYIRYVSLPPPKTLTRYFDMSFVTARLSPTNISKINTGIQLALVAASLAAPVFSFVDHFYLHVLWYITGTTTILSAASYVYYKNSTFKLFSSAIEKEK